MGKEEPDACVGGEVGLALNQPPPIWYSHIGAPTHLGEPDLEALAESQSRSHHRGQDIPKDREDTSPGPHQPKFSDWQVPQYAPSASVGGGASQSHCDETVPQVTGTHQMQGFKGDKQHLELHLEANRQWVQHAYQWCNMGHYKSPENWPHCCSLYQL